MSNRRFRTVRSWYKPNDGSRTLAASVVAPEVWAALLAWSAAKIQGVLIGDLALSYWSLPRHTQDIDILVDAQPLPQIDGFKHIRPHAWLHSRTGVEVEVFDPHFLRLSEDFFNRVNRHSVTQEGVRIASPSGLIALKLKRFSRQDQADIENLLAPASKESVLDTFGPLLTVEEKNRLGEF